MFFKKKEKELTAEVQQRFDYITEQCKKCGSSFIVPYINIRDGYNNPMRIERECLVFNKGYDGNSFKREVIIDKEGFIEAYKTWILPLIESGELK